MSRDIELIGMIGTADSSETRSHTGPAIDAEYTRAFARAHEDGGFDRVLIGYGSNRPDGVQVAAHVAAVTERLGLLIAHRPGVVAPTVASRTFATLDQFTEGRVALNIVSGGADIEQRRDGDYLSKDERYARTDEYLQILRSAWDIEGARDFAGEHYRFEGYQPGVHPWHGRHLELYFGGSSPAAYAVGSRRADTFMLWGEPLKETGEQIAEVRRQAAAAGRAVPPRISVSFRPIIAPTDDQAWDRAHRILGQIQGAEGAAFKDRWARSRGADPQNTGSQRLLAAAARGERHDRALWTATSAASGAGGNSTALVGSPETVAAAILDYWEIGVDAVLVRGYDPLQDAVDYGRDLLPLVRQEVAHRQAAAPAAS